MSNEKVIKLGGLILLVGTISIVAFFGLRFLFPQTIVSTAGDWIYVAIFILVGTSVFVGIIRRYEKLVGKLIANFDGQSLLLDRQSLLLEGVIGLAEKAVAEAIEVQAIAREAQDISKDVLGDLKNEVKESTDDTKKIRNDTERLEAAIQASKSQLRELESLVQSVEQERNKLPKRGRSKKEAEKIANRQAEAKKLRASGRTVKEIAEILDVSEETIERDLGMRI